mmetsp:Transcript_12062/g.18508  ORF Transcript_12062/g.18508 Transcript_12062/m.18508 type:complete len:95 (+) Transcript_12062:1543-1827(+)
MIKKLDNILPGNDTSWYDIAKRRHDKKRANEMNESIQRFFIIQFRFRTDFFLFFYLQYELQTSPLYPGTDDFRSFCHAVKKFHFIFLLAEYSSC